MRGRSATPQRVGQRLRSRTLLTPRYLCPRDRGNAGITDVEGHTGGGEVRCSLASQGSLSDQDQAATRAEAGESEGACPAQDSGEELAALAQHSVGEDGGIPPRCAGCDDLCGLWYGGRDISSFGTRRPVRSSRQHHGRPRHGFFLQPCWHLLRSSQ